jgi:hypothetical protein
MFMQIWEVKLLPWCEGRERGSEVFVVLFVLQLLLKSGNENLAPIPVQLSEYESIPRKLHFKSLLMNLSWNLPFYPYPVFEEILPLYPLSPVKIRYLPGKVGGNDFTHPYPNLR